ncbi:MAG TPA: TatD family hydrolase, partial [Spirochaetota bacterium]
MNDIQFIDTHAHFDICMKDAGYSEDFLLSEMRKSHVETAVQISTERTDFDWCALFSEKHDHIFFTLGIHPSSSFSEDDLAALGSKVATLKDSPMRKKLIGIGEIGLDYYWNKENREEQIRLFERQLSIAREADLPVIIHSRDALDET